MEREAGIQAARAPVMRLQDIMTREIQTISPAATIEDARAAMKLNGVRHLLVQDGDEIVGLVSERDFGIRPGTAERQRVADVMSADLVTGTPEMTVRQAANLFRGHSLGCLPVLAGDKPVGIVTTTDLLELLGREAERPVGPSTRWTLRDRGPRRVGPTSRHARRR